jgi:hypothetical protein
VRIPANRRLPRVGCIEDVEQGCMFSL